MAMNSSPARIVRESIETPASRATGSRPCPRLPATASATCVTVHRIVASKSLLAPEFGRSVHFVRSVLLGAFSPVEGSSFVCESLPLARSPPFLALPARARAFTCQTLFGLLAAPRTPARSALFALLRDRQNGSCGPRKSGSPRGPCPPAAQYLPRALLQSPDGWPLSGPVRSCIFRRISACPPRCR